MRNAEPEQANTSSTRNFFPLTALVATIALSIRWTIASGDPLWLDELHTSWTVSDGLFDVGGRAIDGNQNPLFFWMTWGTVQVLGSSELALRLISVLSGTTLVGGASWFTWRSSKSLTAVLLTSLIIAFDWRFVFYGTEARPYALMQLLGLVHAGLFASLLGWLRKSESKQLKTGLSDSSKWSVLTLLSIALFYCHITCVWLFAAELLALIFAWGQRKPDFLKPLLLSFFAAIVGCLPGFLNLAQVFARKANWSELSSPVGVLTDTKEPLLVWIALPIVLFLLSWLFNRVISRPETTRGKSFSQTPLIVLIVLWAVIPIAGVIAAHYLKVAPLASFRYTLIGTPAMAILSGLLIGQMPNAKLKVVAIVLIAWSSYHNNQVTRQLVDRQTLPVLRHEDWNTATDIVRTTTTDQQRYPRPLLLFANVIEDADAMTNLDPRFQNYLRFPAYNILSANNFIGRQVFACPTHRSPRLSEELIQNVIQSRGGWLLIRGRDETVQSIVNEVQQTLSENLPSGTTKNLQIEERNDNGDVVHLFSVDLL